MQISFNLGTMSFKNVEAEGKSLSMQISDVIRKVHDEARDANGEGDSKKMAEIQAKIKRGKKLSSKEETYLKEHNPELYMQYQRIRKMVEAMENRLKNAKSKEEVNDIVYQSINSVSDKDPYKEAIVAAREEAVKEFKKSDVYKKLPATSDEANEAQNKNTNKQNEEDSEEEEDEFDPMSWTPLQEVIDAMPSFDFQS